MKKSLLVRMLAVIVAVMFMAASGWAADPKAPTKPAPAPDKKVEKKAEKVAEPIDLNTATKEQLMTLTGVGEVTAQQIIKNRPYAKKDQLKSKKILTDQGYDKIKDKIIAKQPPKKK
ncbi:MAG: helix-hairpin-helix domain-containing protein [Deltaproteobacteria bacterium]|nr:helix-hairpin-helix domain-containing protein [Deltaproteobacteria bacterium]